MTNNDWDEIAERAIRKTDRELAREMTSLTRLNDADIEQLISETGIDAEGLNNMLQILKDATQSNELKAEALRNFGKGIEVLVYLSSKFL